MAKRTALVTGASGGIGQAFALVLAERGFDLVLTARNEEALAEASDQCRRHGVGCVVIAADLSEQDAPSRLWNALLDAGLSVDVLINNAGFGDYGFFAQGDIEKQRAMMQLNISALTELTRLALPGMQQRGWGRVLNVASTAAFQPGPLMAVYYASKAYVLSFSVALSDELKGTGVTVTALCPGPTDTGFIKAANAAKNPLFKLATMPTAESVARYGYRQMMRARTVAVPGFMNKLAIAVMRHLPMVWSAAIVRQIQSRR